MILKVSRDVDNNYCIRSAFKMQIFLSFNQFRLLCEHPCSGELSEKTLEVHKNQTLGEATERAYKVDSALVSLLSHIFSPLLNSVTETNLL